ncbi:MAG: methyltransferase domain-containing protein [Rhodospirillaceae bacterium]|nr:methyltransferase domain-containing protein [Rhodospirillaceae bacterium]
MSELHHADVFDRTLLRRHRSRAAQSDWYAHDFLVRHGADLLADRLDDVLRGFARVLDLGCHGGEMVGHLAGRRGMDWLVLADGTPAMAARARGPDPGHPAVAADEEWLPFAEASFDLVVSNLSLHWVNDLPGALVQINRALKPDGLFLATLIGGETLWELRQVLVEAEARVLGGASQRLSPLVQLRDAAGLLQRAGFALPVADSQTVTVTYPSLFRLIADLRGMGQTAAHRLRDRRVLPRRFWVEAAALYGEKFGTAEGRITATFEVICLAGWAPATGQPKPLRPGSASHSLAAALGTDERDAGDSVG